MLAAIRADDINFPLFLHVFGAMLLTGGLFTVALATILDWKAKSDSLGLKKLAFKSVLIAVFPAYILMRVGAQWTSTKEGLDDSEATWLTIGYITADLGALLVLVSLVLSIIGLKKLKSGNGLTLNRVTGVISVLLFVAFIVTVWAMSVQPA